MTYRPAYLGDAELGDTIRFELPADAHGGRDVYEGTLWAYDRDNTHVPHPLITFTLSGHVAHGPFKATPNLHIDLAARKG
jgi:hypothetical protein